MPDFTDSTGLPVPAAQKALRLIASELQRLDGRLSSLAMGIATDDPAAVLPSKLRAAVESIRADLLQDAISSLTALAALTEDDALERRLEVAAAVEQIAALV